MENLGIKNGYYIIVDLDISSCKIDLGRSIRAEGVDSVTIKCAKGFVKYYENNNTEHSMILDLGQSDFSEIVGTYILTLMQHTGIGPDFVFRKENDKLVNFFPTALRLEDDNDEN